MFSKENAISATGLAGSLRPLRSYHPASAECSMFHVNDSRRFLVAEVLRRRGVAHGDVAEHGVDDVVAWQGSGELQIRLNRR